MLSGRRPTQRLGGARTGAEPTRGRVAADRAASADAEAPVVTLAHFRAFELVDEPAVLIDPDVSRVRWANAAAVALWRLDAAALVGGDAPWPDPGSAAAWRQHLAEAPAGESRLSYRRPCDGGDVALRARLVRMVGDVPLLFLRVPGAAMDDAGARFRDFAEVSSDWFWELDHELRFSYLSPGVEQRTGEQVSGLIGRVPTQQGLEAVSDEAWAAHMADLQARRPVVDFRFARHDGTGRLRHF
jgi:PAS domain-containing protein